MNEVVKKLLWAGDKFIPEINLRQARFIFTASGSFTKNKEKIQKLKKQEIHDIYIYIYIYIYQNEPDKTWFQHDMVYGDFKDLPRRTASDKVLCNQTFNIAKNTKYDGKRSCANDALIFW